MFLLDAKKLQKSMARLRYWLIMAMRMLAIAGLIFAIARPLSSGWLGSAVGSKADTVLLLLDRSPSMEQQDPTTLQTKRATALAKLQDLLKTTGEGKRVVLIESTQCKAEEVSINQLTELPAVQPAAAESDVPRMLQAAEEYLVTNEVGQADIWIASDLRANDWREEDGRWVAIRDSFSELDGVRLHLLTYEQTADDNLAVTVSGVRKRKVASGTELVLDVMVQRESEKKSPRTIPLEFTVNGARSVLEVEIADDEFALQGHVIPIDNSVEAGWGRVEVPGDTNAADNSFYFAFSDEATRNIAIVSNDPPAANPLKVASLASPDPSIEFEGQILPATRVSEIDWDAATLVLWNAPLPTGLEAEQLTAYLRKGKPVIFVPPTDTTSSEFAGVSWGSWQDSTAEPIGIGSWDNESDLLARTQSGNALPVGKQKTAKYCKLVGVGRTLARFTNGDPLLLRADGDLPAYFFATSPRSDTSSLARDGVVLYVMIQRAIELGAKQQSLARQVDAGARSNNTGGTQTDPAKWDLLTELPDFVTTTERSYFSGCYSLSEQKRVAINRPPSEDSSGVLSDETLKELFAGLDYQKISDEVGQGSALANEIWRVFLALMAVALVFEAALCLG